MRLVLTTAVLVCCVEAARADIAPDPLAAMGNVQLMKGKAPDIRMASEEVNITLHPSFAVVDATFVMANDGAEQKLEIGFPGQGVMVDGRFSAHMAIHGLKAWVNGVEVPAVAKEVSFTERAGPPGSNYKRERRETWHLFNAVFSKKGTTTVRVKYGVVAKLHYGQGSIGDGPPPLDEVWYVLHTGASWKGAIGSAVVRVVAGDGVDAASINMVNHGPVPGLSSPEKWEPYKLPSGAKRTAKGLELSFRELTPTAADNVQLVFRCDPEKRNLGSWGADEAKVLPALKRALD